MATSKRSKSKRSKRSKSKTSKRSESKASKRSRRSGSKNRTRRSRSRAKQRTGRENYHSEGLVYNAPAANDVWPNHERDQKDIELCQRIQNEHPHLDREEGGRIHPQFWTSKQRKQFIQTHAKVTHDDLALEDY